jgi:hypothetical protein
MPRASTGAGGFALQNGTPTILTWTAPNDGQLHTGFVTGSLAVSTAETGGQINAYGPQAGTGVVIQGAGKTAGQWTFPNSAGSFTFSLQPGQSVTIAQATALTAGAAILYAEIWAS